jgi:cephalosporin-C deacetylase-like acetyl esterase
MTHRWIVAQAMKYFRLAQQVRQSLRTPAQVRAYLERMRNLFLERLGGLPQRTPLRPRTLGKLKHRHFTVEKIVFESRPGLLVAANLYIPRGLTGRAPGVVVTMGHADDAKTYPEYQRVCQALVMNGFVTLGFDPIGQGERFQFPDKRGFKSRLRYCVNEHGTLSWRTELLGYSLGGFMVYDGIRALDYLSHRPEVDADRLAVTGCSGGGTQTAFIAAIDRRLKAAVPNCYITDRRILVEQEQLTYDPEQVQHGVVRDGLDHAELLGLAVPAATLVQGGLQDLGFHPAGTRRSVATAKKWFDLLGLKGKLRIQQEPVGHGYFKPFRKGTVGWFAKYLQGRELQFDEPRLHTYKRRELWCSRGGNVLQLGSRTVLDLLREELSEITRPASVSDAALLEVLGLSEKALNSSGQVRACGGAKWRGHALRRFLIRGEKGIVIPAIVVQPSDGEVGGAVVVVSERGKNWEIANNKHIEQWLAQGQAVVLADLRGLGEMRQTKNMWWSPTPHWCYTIGHEGFLQEWIWQLGDSLIGARTRDLAAVLAFARRQSCEGERRIGIFARGITAWSAAVLARFKGVDSLTMVDFLASFEEVFRVDVPKVPPGYVVHGGIKVFDLPQLMASLAPLPLRIESPQNAHARPLNADQIEKTFRPVEQAYRKAGHTGCLQMKCIVPRRHYER